eukprot:TRINITY_DN951_c0_g1_i2.p1 TRINITY_DN951_c0_g1~~TRINITY_DN951_c0_g1_i2.p1  ORF type:complete len:1420 (+),score=271.34 TRINITY_DN951_c0_g1_i2:114-4373(+)
MSHLSASSAGKRLSVQRLPPQRLAAMEGDEDDQQHQPVKSGSKVGSENGTGSPGQGMRITKATGPQRPAPTIPSMNRAQSTTKVIDAAMAKNRKNESPASGGSSMHAAFMSKPPPAIGASTNGGAPPPVPAFKKPSDGGGGSGPGSPASVHPAFASAPPPKVAAPQLHSPAASRRSGHPAFSSAPPKLVEEESTTTSPSLDKSKPPPPPISEFRTTGGLSAEDDDDWNAEEDVFAEADSEDNLRFEPDTVQQPRPIIRGGTLEKLVQRLTYEKYPDPDFVAAFLLTYRSFTTPPELLALLIARWDVPAPRDANETTLAEFTKAVLEPVRLRVFNVLQKWVSHHFYDFAEDRSLVDTILDFISDKMMANKESAALQLKRMVNRKLEGNDAELEVQFGQVQPPRPIPPMITGAAMTLLDLDPTEVARQLTLIEHSLYKSIMPRECLGQAWTKATRNERAPHIMAMISRFNAVSRFFATEIVKETNIRRRADMLNHIIMIAVGCEKLNNYNAMMEIVSSLQCSSIYRLRHTWGMLPKGTLKAYEQIQALMSREKNFKVFREHLHSVDPPCIPYLGVYLTDLTFIEDANNDYLSDSQKLINFDKRRKISLVIREIQQYQQAPYCLEALPVIRDYLLNSEFWGENETFDASLKLEPKGMPAPTLKKKDMIAASASRLKLKLNKEGMKSKGDGSGSQLVRPDTTPVQQASAVPVEEEEDWGELELASGYKFGIPDSKEHINFDVDLSALVGVEAARPSILSATLPKLIERLTHENWPDPALVNTFLLTYTTFTTRKEVLDLLAMRFNVPVPVNKDKDLQDRYNTSKATPIRLRVFNVLKNWSGDRYFHDCVADPQFISEFNSLADTMASIGMEKPAQAIKRAVQRQIEGVPENVERRTVGKPPKSYLPKNLSPHPRLSDFHPEEIARQLTLIEHQLFQQLKPWELLRNVWTSPTAEKQAPNVLVLMRREDRIRDWVATEIVSQDSPEDAATYITHWIKIAEKCLNLNNFHTLVEIIKGLLLPDIQKLKLVWSSVSSRNTFNKLKSLIDGDYEKLQDKLHNVQPPCLPYLGAYLHQLTELETKHADQIDGLINFEKWTLIGGVISEINQYQNTLYCLDEVPFIQEWVGKVEIYPANRINEESITLLTRAPRSKTKKVERSGTLPSINEAVISARRESADQGNLGDEDFPSRREPTRAPSRMKISKLLGADEQLIQQQQQALSRGSVSSRASISEARPSSGGGSSGGSGELGIDRQAALKFQVMTMFLDDTEFRQSIADLLLKDLRDSLSVLHHDLSDIKRALPASGGSSRGGSSSKELVPRDIICGHFPGRNLSVWTREDREGMVYGWDETITVYTVTEGNNVSLADVRPNVTKPDVATLLRLAKFYSKETNRSSDPKIYVFSPSINEDARAIATKCANQIELVSV